MLNNETLVNFDGIQFPMAEIVRSSFKKSFRSHSGMAVVYEEDVDLDVLNLLFSEP